jgi:hypothetical protein
VKWETRSTVRSWTCGWLKTQHCAFTSREYRVQSLIMRFLGRLFISVDVPAHQQLRASDPSMHTNCLECVASRNFMAHVLVQRAPLDFAKHGPSSSKADPVVCELLLANGQWRARQSARVVWACTHALNMTPQLAYQIISTHCVWACSLRLSL